MFATIIRWYRIALVPHGQFNLFSTFDESLSVLGHHFDSQEPSNTVLMNQYL